MLLCHFKFSFKEDKLNFRFIGTLKVKQGFHVKKIRAYRTRLENKLDLM